MHFENRADFIAYALVHIYAAQSNKGDPHAIPNALEAAQKLADLAGFKDQAKAADIMSTQLEVPARRVAGPQAPGEKLVGVNH